MHVTVLDTEFPTTCNFLNSKLFGQKVFLWWKWLKLSLMNAFVPASFSLVDVILEKKDILKSIFYMLIAGWHGQFIIIVQIASHGYKWNSKR